jgi:hypothetical protein
MPQVFTVPFLWRICVNFIADNMEKFSKKSSTSELEAIDAEAVPFYHFQELRNKPNTFIQSLSSYCFTLFHV